jgi:hypothetical protein
VIFLFIFISTAYNINFLIYLSFKFFLSSRDDPSPKLIRISKGLLQTHKDLGLHKLYVKHHFTCSEFHPRLRYRSCGYMRQSGNTGLPC